MAGPHTRPSDDVLAVGGDSLRALALPSTASRHGLAIDFETVLLARNLDALLSDGVRKLTRGFVQWR